MTRVAVALLVVALVGTVPLAAHDGPPFPIVPTRVVGPYALSVWADPDTTDDGSAGGQFWVMLEPAGGGTLPDGTRADVAIRPLDRPGPSQAGHTEPVDGIVGRQFVALPMDHEGPFAVRVHVSGALGAALVEAEVDATYDLRPPAALLVVYLVPFVAVGVVWLKLLIKRRRAGARPS